MGDFLEETEHELAAAGQAQDVIARLRDPFQKLLISDFLPPEFMRAEPGRFLQYLVHRPEDRSWSLMAMVVAPGVATPIHDHLAWGLVGVYRGRQAEQVYRRVDDRRSPGHASLELTEENLLEPGSITTLLPPEGDIHRIVTTSSIPSVSIHLLGNDIGCELRHAFDIERQTVTDFRSGYVNAECSPISGLALAP